MIKAKIEIDIKDAIDSLSTTEHNALIDALLADKSDNDLLGVLIDRNPNWYDLELTRFVSDIEIKLEYLKRFNKN